MEQSLQWSTQWDTNSKFVPKYFNSFVAFYESVACTINM